MTWTAGIDRTTGALVAASDWNKYLGATGSLMETSPAKVTTAGDFAIATGAGALARIASADVFPWEVNVDVFAGPPSAFSGSYSGPFPSNAAPVNVQLTGAQNEYVEWPIVLAAGTWSVFVLAYTDGASGISTASVDGSSVGTMDWYSASQVISVQKSVTGIAVAATGKKLVRFTMATKNASSSAYKWTLQAVKLRRTA